jgi:cytochrome bd-type quinol oxidase subunit 2
MFWVTVILMPLIATYTTWAYAKMRGKIDPETIRAEY